MVRVIKDNTIQFQTICEHCGSELEYSQGDIFELSFQYDRDGGMSTIIGKPCVITCPVCDYNTTVPRYVVTR